MSAFQDGVQDWLQYCFGATIAADITERCDRALEEQLELGQSVGHARESAHALVDYVYDRPAGEPEQELGGVMVTLAALAQAIGLDMAAAGKVELARVWTKVDQIRAKQAAKPRYSPLPERVPVTTPPGLTHAQSPFPEPFDPEAVRGLR